MLRRKQKVQSKGLGPVEFCGSLCQLRLDSALQPETLRKTDDVVKSNPIIFYVALETLHLSASRLLVNECPQ